jgi:hypothetical protein
LVCSWQLGFGRLVVQLHLLLQLLLLVKLLPLV